MAKMGLLYNEARVGVNRVAKKKVAIAKSSKGTGPHFNKPLAQFLNARIGTRPPKMTATEVSESGGVSQTHISDLKKGKKSPESVTVEILVKLADGMGESPETLFNIARGETSGDPQEDRLRQILKDYEKLTDQQRAELDAEFLLKELRSRIRRKLHGDT